jgi:hypothetical protein
LKKDLDYDSGDKLFNLTIRAEVRKIININQFLGKFATVWDSLEQSGTVWDILGKFKTIWDNLGQLGTILNMFEHFGAIWDLLGYFGTVWDNVEWIETFWDAMGQKIYNSQEHTRKSGM